MINTGQDISEAGLENCARGYVGGDHGRHRSDPIVNPTTLIGNGDLYSSVEDLYQWEQALQAGKIISPKSIQTVFSSHVFMEGSTKRSHGYGWFLDKQLDKRIAEYSGALRGFLSKYVRFMDDGLTIILLSNLEDQSQFCQICDGLIGVIFDQ